jgi:hypothetical protein
MKEIVNKIDVPCPKITVEEANELSLQKSVFILTCSQFDNYILCYEPRGYIFRKIENEKNKKFCEDFAGSHGHAATIKDSLKEGLDYGKIHQFDSYKEASKFIMAEGQ